MKIPDTLLGDLSAEEFLRDYWQKKPLLIRQALPGVIPFFTPDELAGLSLEEEVESRLVIEKDGTEPWQVIHGPQQEETYARLPESHWTLLVQEVNRHLPEVAELFELFTFLPAWRLDDIMVSYAEDQGSVGPHTDNYDVFLLQVEGKRRWQISSQQVGEEDLIPDIAMRIMKGFQPEQEWVLEPGDMLYLPPGVPHHGVAQGPCMTISIGFRAPTRIGMWQHYLDEACLSSTDAFYSDADIHATDQPGLISSTARDRIRNMIRQLPMDDMHIDDWLGRFITEPMRGSGPYPTGEEISAEEFKQLLSEYGVCLRSEETRYAYLDDENGFRLYINGERIEHAALTPELGRLIADKRRYGEAELQPYLQAEQAELLCRFHDLGYLYFPYEYEDED